MNFPFFKITVVAIIWFTFLFIGCKNDLFPFTKTPETRKLCIDASDSLTRATKRYKDSLKVHLTDTIFQNTYIDNYAKALRYFIKIGVENKCFSDTVNSDYKNYSRTLAVVPGKCNQALLIVETTGSNFNKSINFPKDSIPRFTDCQTYSNAVEKYIKVGKDYKCISSSDLVIFNNILTNLNCKCDYTEAILVSLNKAKTVFETTSTLPKDSLLKKANCVLYSNSINKYLNTFQYKCKNKADSLIYVKTLAGLSCK
jgi:hypothetical protein